MHSPKIPNLRSARLASELGATRMSVLDSIAHYVRRFSDLAAHTFWIVWCHFSEQAAPGRSGILVVNILLEFSLRQLVF